MPVESSLVTTVVVHCELIYVFSCLLSAQCLECQYAVVVYLLSLKVLEKKDL